MPLTRDASINRKAINDLRAIKGAISSAGERKNRKPEGAGSIVWENGESYNGEWINGVFDVQGACCFADESVYTGEWPDSEANGYGALTYADGESSAGFWKGGNLAG